MGDAANTFWQPSLVSAPYLCLTLHFENQRFHIFTHHGPCLFLGGIKEEDLGMNPQLMWLRGDYGDRGIQAVNFQGVGVTPWMQPRLDASMLGLQPDMYQAMAAAALQEMRTVDPSKPIPTSLLQFQQTQNLPSRSAVSLMQPQMLQQSQPQQAFLQGMQENQHSTQSQPQTSSHLLQQQLQHQHSFNSNNSHQQQTPQQQQQQQLVDHHQQISGAVSPMSHFSSASQSQSPSLQAISSMCQQQSFPDSNGTAVTSSIVSPLHSILGSFPSDESSHLLNLPRSNLSSAGWPSKRAAVVPLISSGPSQCVLPQVEQFGPPQTNISQSSVSLPPFPGRECTIDQEGTTDPQSHLLFGVNIEPSSLLMQNGMSNLRGVGSDSDTTTLPFPSSSYMSTTGTDFSLNPAITTSSCIDESGFLRSPENAGQGNQSSRTFVKVSCLWLPNYTRHSFTSIFSLFSLHLRFNK